MERTRIGLRPRVGARNAGAPVRLRLGEGGGNVRPVGPVGTGLGFRFGVARRPVEVEEEELEEALPVLVVMAPVLSALSPAEADDETVEQVAFPVRLRVGEGGGGVKPVPSPRGGMGQKAMPVRLRLGEGGGWLRPVGAGFARGRVPAWRVGR